MDRARIGQGAQPADDRRHQVEQRMIRPECCRMARVGQWRPRMFSLGCESAHISHTTCRSSAVATKPDRYRCRRRMNNWKVIPSPGPYCADAVFETACALQHVEPLRVVEAGIPHIRLVFVAMNGYRQLVLSSNGVSLLTCRDDP